MTTKEAIQAMLDGKKVRNKMWSSYIYMYFDGDMLVDSNGIKFNNLSMSFTDDWEIYEEPKPKQTVVIEKWLCYDNLAESYSICAESNIDGFINDNRAYLSKVKLIETLETPL